MKVERKTGKNHLKRKFFMRIKKNVCGIILCMAVLGWQTGVFQLVYGFDEYAGYSEGQSFDTGGFDMDIGEGTGQFPDNWDSADNENGNQTDDGGTYEDYGDYSWSRNAGENLENSGQGSADESNWSDWSENNDNWQDSTQWGNVQAEAGNYYEADNGGNSGSGNSGSDYSAGSGEVSSSGIEGSNSGNAATQFSNDQLSVIAATDTPGPTSTPKISSSPTPAPTRKPKKTKTPTSTPKVSNNPGISPGSKKQQKLALSYYETNEKAASSSEADKNTADEKLPEFFMEIQDSHIQLTIKQNASMTPLQILSFRINGKECTWHWQGEKLTAEIPKDISSIKKAEFLLSMCSGKLYHEIMDLKDEQ